MGPGSGPHSFSRLCVAWKMQQQQVFLLLLSPGTRGKSCLLRPLTPQSVGGREKGWASLRLLGRLACTAERRRSGSMGWRLGQAPMGCVLGGSEEGQWVVAALGWQDSNCQSKNDSRVPLAQPS